MIPENLVRVKRDGHRGWHLIAREKYEAAPDTYTLVDDEADIARDEAAKRRAAAAARQAQTDGAPAPQEGQGGPAPEQSESDDSAAARPGAGEQGVPHGLTAADAPEISIDVEFPDAIIVTDGATGAPGAGDGDDSAAAQPAAGEHETPPWDEDGAAAGAGHAAGQAESAAGAPESVEGGNGAAAAEARDLTVGKGPKGLWFVKAGGVIASPGFPTEEAANAALAEIAAGERK
jgi:hypothetical protein